MPGLDDPFTPGKSPDPAAGVEPGQFDKLRSQWDTFLANPQGRAALLSAGINMMQPPSFGDNTMSKIGQAIGAAGQSATANQAMDIKESEAESKQDLRVSQGMLSEARANTAGANAGLAQERLASTERSRAANQQLRLLGLKINASNQYDKYRKSVEERNALVNPKDKPEPIMSREDFIKSNPMLAGTGLLDESGKEVEVPAAASTTTGRRTPSPAAIAALKADPTKKDEFDSWYGAGSAASVGVR